jgi:ferredoxin
VVIAGASTITPVARMPRVLLERVARRHRAEELTVAVDAGRCASFGFCEQEAPAIFALRSDRRLAYKSVVSSDQAEAAMRAATVCPARAIALGRLPTSVVLAQPGGEEVEPDLAELLESRTDLEPTGRSAGAGVPGATRAGATRAYPEPAAEEHAPAFRPAVVALPRRTPADTGSLRAAEAPRGPADTGSLPAPVGQARTPRRPADTGSLPAPVGPAPRGPADTGSVPLRSRADTGSLPAPAVPLRRTPADTGSLPAPAGQAGPLPAPVGPRTQNGQNGQAGPRRTQSRTQSRTQNGQAGPRRVTGGALPPPAAEPPAPPLPPPSDLADTGRHHLPPLRGIPGGRSGAGR